MDESKVRVNRKRELVRAPESCSGNSMIGIAYLLEKNLSYVVKAFITFVSLNDLMLA